MRDRYPVTTEEITTAGVKTKIVTPQRAGRDKEHRVLINFHGGGFTSDSGSLIETIPIASLTGTKVIAVEYRLAPQNPFAAAVDDAAAECREVLKTHNALPHAHWYSFELPESQEALHAQPNFLDHHLS